VLVQLRDDGGLVRRIYLRQLRLYRLTEHLADRRGVGEGAQCVLRGGGVAQVQRGGFRR
jgi:hypothetical protein